MRYKIGGENRVTKNWLNGGGKEKRKRKIRTEKDAKLAASIRWIDHLYSAGGIASALHSNEAPENNNAVVSRSGPTELIVGGSAWKLNLLYRFSIDVLSVEIKRKVLLTGFARTRNPGWSRFNFFDAIAREISRDRDVNATLWTRYFINFVNLWLGYKVYSHLVVNRFG